MSWWGSWCAESPVPTEKTQLPFLPALRKRLDANMNENDLKYFLESRMNASDLLIDEKFKRTQVALELQAKENERRFNALDNNVEKIMSNHIPHLQAEIDRLKTNIAYYVGALAAVGFLLQLVIAFLRK